MPYPSPLGFILQIDFPMAQPTGREQTHLRPAVVVGAPDFLQSPAYPGLVVVPFTSRLERLASYARGMYPHYARGMGGLTRDSAALVDQVRFVDAVRIQGNLGRLTEQEYEPIRLALAAILPR